MNYQKKTLPIPVTVNKGKTYHTVEIAVGVAGETGLGYHPVFGGEKPFRYVVVHVASGTTLPVGTFADERSAQRFITRAATLADWQQPRTAFLILRPAEKDALRQALTQLYETLYPIAPE